MLTLCDMERTVRAEEGRRRHGGARSAAAAVGGEGVDAAVGSRASRPDSAGGEGEKVLAEVVVRSVWLGDGRNDGEARRPEADREELGREN